MRVDMKIVDLHGRLVIREKKFTVDTKFLIENRLPCTGNIAAKGVICNYGKNL